MALFQAKIGLKMTRKRENKNYRSVLFIFEQLKNTIMASF